MPKISCFGSFFFSVGVPLAHDIVDDRLQQGSDVHQLDVVQVHITWDVLSTDSSRRERHLQRQRVVHVVGTPPSGKFFPKPFLDLHNDKGPVCNSDSTAGDATTKP